MESEGKRVAIYTRVSTEEQTDGHSLSAQEDAGRRFAAQRGWQVVSTYEEAGRSGKSAIRPEFQQMVRDAEAGLFDVIVVHKLDRFSRSLLDVLTYLKRLNECNVSFVSATEDFDFTTPFGKVILAMLASFAEWYLDNLKTEISKGKKERARKGYWNGALSWGYTTPRRLQQLLFRLGEQFKAGDVDKAEYSRQSQLIEDALERHETAHETQAIPCPFAAPGVRLAFEQYSRGIYSDRDIANLVNAAGYRIEGRRGNTLLSKDTIQDVLVNRFYLGQTSYGRRVKGKSRQWMPGNHEPLIDQDLFGKCQNIRARRRETFAKGMAASKAVYPLSGLVVCLECGVRWKGQKARDERRYRDPARDKGQSCVTWRKSIRADELEMVIQDFVTDLVLPSDWRKRIEGALSKQQPNRENVLQQRQRLQKRLERMKQLYLFGDLTEREYLNMRSDVKSQWEAVSTVEGYSVGDLKSAGEMLGSFEAVWRLATLEEKGELAKAMFRKIYVRDGTVKAIEPTPVMWVLLISVLPTAGRTGVLSSSGITLVATNTPIEQVRKVA